MDNNTTSGTTSKDTITTRSSMSLRTSSMTNTLLTTTKRQESMSTTTIQVTSPSLTFSNTVVALMVCIPLAVLTIIIVAVCICIRRGANRQGSETYEDFSKVDQSAMMRMSMYNALDDERAANEDAFKSHDHPDENGYTIKDSNKDNQILKENFELQNDDNKSVDDSSANESEISSTPSQGSKAISGDYYTLKANFIPLPE
ncbi:hypothetical protein FSP39_016647 [Pinctada imbricata]|uniref:Uncharacterized protein n=1 Tax=Pinctada imbricata TaxID=66713 RepID=A0AA89C6Q8_PINIB|nr:hypothetical protein FSP39_016647 [Pinctada imbricata]